MTKKYIFLYLYKPSDCFNISFSTINYKYRTFIDTKAHKATSLNKTYKYYSFKSRYHIYTPKNANYFTVDLRINSQTTHEHSGIYAELE